MIFLYLMFNGIFIYISGKIIVKFKIWKLEKVCDLCLKWIIYNIDIIIKVNNLYKNVYFMLLLNF